MKNIKFDLAYKKDHNGLIEDYSGVIITGYYSSKDEGTNIGYQALVPDGERFRPARFSYYGIREMKVSVAH